MEILTLSESYVERLLDVERLVEALAHGFIAVSDQQVSVPRRIAAMVIAPVDGRPMGRSVGCSRLKYG